MKTIKRKAATILIIATIITAVIITIGCIYLAQKGQKTFVPVVADEVKTGHFDIDMVKVNELQEAVNNGHQPWRLDPLMVAKAEALKYNFVAQDNFTLKELVKSLGLAKVEAVHNRTNYLITLIQITPGEGKIWILQKIEK